MSEASLQLRARRLRDLLAGLRDIPALNPLAGIVSGPGNQGSACVANLQGHAGTPASFLGVARALGPPGSWGGTPN